MNNPPNKKYDWPGYMFNSPFDKLREETQYVKPVKKLEIEVIPDQIWIKASTIMNAKERGFELWFRKTKSETETKTETETESETESEVMVKYQLIQGDQPNGDLRSGNIGKGDHIDRAVQFLQPFLFINVTREEPIIDEFKVHIRSDLSSTNGENPYETLSWYWRKRAGDNNHMQVRKFIMEYDDRNIGGSKEILNFLPYIKLDERDGELILKQTPSRLQKFSTDGLAELAGLQDPHKPNKLTVEGGFKVVTNPEVFARFKHSKIQMDPDVLDLETAKNLIDNFNNSYDFESCEIRFLSTVTNPSANEIPMKVWNNFAENPNVEGPLKEVRCLNTMGIACDIVLSIDDEWKFTFKKDYVKPNPAAIDCE